MIPNLVPMSHREKQRETDKQTGRETDGEEKRELERKNIQRARWTQTRQSQTDRQS